MNRERQREHIYCAIPFLWSSSQSKLIAREGQKSGYPLWGGYGPREGGNSPGWRSICIYIWMVMIQVYALKSLAEPFAICGIYCNYLSPQLKTKKKKVALPSKYLLKYFLFFQAFSCPYYLSECLTISSIIITMLYNYLNPWLSPFQRPETICVLHVHSQHLAGDTGMRCLFNNYLSKEKKTVNEWVKKLFTLLFYSLG